MFKPNFQNSEDLLLAHLEKYGEIVDEPLLARLRADVGTYQGYCVEYIKNLIGFEGTYGNAWDLRPNKEMPSVGDTILIWWNHAGIIARIYLKDEKIWFTVGDSNGYGGSGRAAIFDISIDDPIIRGYHKK